MDEPVILDGGADRKLKITLPSSFKTEDIEKGMFSVTLKPGTEPKVIVITDNNTGGKETFTITPGNWKIEIK